MSQLRGRTLAERHNLPRFDQYARKDPTLGRMQVPSKAVLLHGLSENEPKDQEGQNGSAAC